MNRRGFLRGVLACAMTAAARIYAPSIISANAQDALSVVAERAQCSYCSEWFDAPVELYHTEQECALNRLTEAANEIHRQQSAGPSFVGMPIDQFIREVKGDFPIEHRSTRVDKGYTLVEFDVMAPCLYVPPAWLNLSMPAPRHLFPGDILSIAVNALQACPVLSSEIEGSS